MTQVGKDIKLNWNEQFFLEMLNFNVHICASAAHGSNNFFKLSEFKCFHLSTC